MKSDLGKPLHIRPLSYFIALQCLPLLQHSQGACKAASQLDVPAGGRSMATTQTHWATEEGCDGGAAGPRYTAGHQRCWRRPESMREESKGLLCMHNIHSYAFPMALQLRGTGPARTQEI